MKESLKELHSNTQSPYEARKLRDQKRGLENAHIIANSHNGTCLSTEYKNYNTQMQWQCDQGHKWNQSIKHIERTLCLICKTRKLTIQQAKEIAKVPNIKTIVKNALAMR